VIDNVTGTRYINIRYNGEVETVDQFDTMKEAREMVKEYNMVQPGHYISQRCTNDWCDR